jgi:hypothetical protein
MIHQALGYGVLEQIKSSQLESKKTLVDFIEDIITPLLPKRQNIRTKLEKTIYRAVDLANAMTCEQGLFRCYAIIAGATMNEDIMDVSDDAQIGRIAFCTFPAFAKRSIQDGEDSRTYILKASVELESIFGGVAPEGEDVRTT